MSSLLAQGMTDEQSKEYGASIDNLGSSELDLTDTIQKIEKNVGQVKVNKAMKFLEDVVEDPSIELNREYEYWKDMCENKCPGALKDAEAAYLRNKSGEHYEDSLRKKYAEEFEKFRTDHTKKFRKLLEEIYILEETRNVSKIYRNRLGELLDYKTDFNKKNQKRIDKYKGITSTNDRKTFYEDQQLNTLKSIHTWFSVIYWLLFVGYLYIVLWRQKKYKSYKAWFIILFFALVPNILLPYTIALITHIVETVRNSWNKTGPKNIYMNIK